MFCCHETIDLCPSPPLFFQLQTRSQNVWKTNTKVYSATPFSVKNKNWEKDDSQLANSTFKSICTIRGVGFLAFYVNKIIFRLN